MLDATVAAVAGLPRVGSNVAGANASWAVAGGGGAGGGAAGVSPAAAAATTIATTSHTEESVVAARKVRQRLAVSERTHTSVNH